MSMRDLFGKISEKLNISGRDAKIFIVSLLLAFSIWLIHNLSLNYFETVRIPISARCDIDGHAYKSSNSAVVLARCRARGFNLIQLKRGEKNLLSLLYSRLQICIRKATNCTMSHLMA